jgi:hypothetical protein
MSRDEQHALTPVCNTDMLALLVIGSIFWFSAGA